MKSHETLRSRLIFGHNPESIHKIYLCLQTRLQLLKDHRRIRIHPEVNMSGPCLTVIHPVDVDIIQPGQN